MVSNSHQRKKSYMDIIKSPSPNFNERGGAQIDMLIIHYTGMKTGEEALERMCDAAAKVSAHYMIEEDGRIFQLVEEGKRAWHAGVSSWDGRSDINGHSIGIELVNPGHEWGYRPFPDVQIEALIVLIEDIKTRHDIKTEYVLGHSDVAPERKQDPGELFPWDVLAQKNLALPRPLKV